MLYNVDFMLALINQISMPLERTSKVGNQEDPFDTDKKFAVMQGCYFFCIIIADTQPFYFE